MSSVTDINITLHKGVCRVYSTDNRNKYNGNQIDIINKSPE